MKGDRERWEREEKESWRKGRGGGTGERGWVGGGGGTIRRGEEWELAG